ncbi:MAG: hypothetical protein PHR28_12190 [candidate division Zixibacteria bacterium]|nr:hypothetical protein [candidate division Zixibacteria bacterium]
MRIGPYDPQSLAQYQTNISRPAAGKPAKNEQSSVGNDDVNISAVGRKLAADSGPDRTEKTSGEANRPGKTERAEKRKDAGFYDRPEIKKDIARRIADEILKDSSTEKGSGKQDDNDDDSNR